MDGNPFASAAELGLMAGFPPPAHLRVDRTNALMKHPFNRWSYQHMRELYPSARIAPSATPRHLTVRDDPAIGRIEVGLPGGGEADLATFLERTYTDAFVVVTPGGIIHQSHLNGMTPTTPHQMMSVTKSFAGLLALMAIADGLIDADATVPTYVPELAASSAFADATVGQVMDMVNSMAFSEDYADPASGIVRYGRVLGWLQAPADEIPEGDLYDFLLTLEKDPTRDHGDAFHYQTPKTDVVNWVTNRATGRSFQDLMADRLWSLVGAEGETYVLLDRRGALVAGGGLNATPHDLARFAMMMLDSGVVDDSVVVPDDVVGEIAAGASREAFVAGPDAVGVLGNGDWSYRAQWWVRHTPGREAFTAIGIHGQWIYVDRGNGVAVVKQSSQPVSADVEMDDAVIGAIDAIVDHLGG